MTSKNKTLDFVEAAKKGNLRVVMILSLDPAVDLNSRENKYDETPFMLACKCGNLDVIDYMLNFKQRHIDFNALDRDGLTVFESCIGRTRKEGVLEMLVDSGKIDLNKKNQEGMTPIDKVTRWGQIENIKWILSSGQKIDLGGVNFEHGMIDSTRELLIDYQKDPVRCCMELRKELGAGKAAGLYSLVVYLSDGYFKIPELTMMEEDVKDDSEKKMVVFSFKADSKEAVLLSDRKEKTFQFFKQASQLPIELQMMLCNMAFGLGDTIVKHQHSEAGFRKFAKDK